MPNNIRHVKYRARMRYGMELNHEDRKAILIQILSKKARLIEKQKQGKKMYEVQLRGRRLCVIYSVSDHALLTVLPERCLERGLNKTREKPAEEETLKTAVN